MSENQRFDFKKQGVDYLKLCLDVTVYWNGSLFNRVEGVIDFYKQGIELIGKDITYYETETMGGPRPIGKETLDLVPFWVANTKTKRGLYILILESGIGPDVPSDKAFVLRAVEYDEKVGAMRLILPIEFIAKSSKPFIELARNLVRELDFVSGHAGYSVNWNEAGDIEAERNIFYLSRRYKGIDLPDLAGTLSGISRGIKCVNWLTFLNPEYCDRIGGISHLRKVFTEEIIIHELKKGIIIQAGSKPNIGDINLGVELKLYHEVGKELAPIRMREHPAFIMYGEDIYEEETTEEWLGRFDI